MNSLVGVIIRFRQDHIALVDYIEAMIHQVRVKYDDCDALRFLGWPNGELGKQPKCYQMQVHLFRGTSSPSCAAYALKRTAIDIEDYLTRKLLQLDRETFMWTIFLNLSKQRIEPLGLHRIYKKC